MKHRIEGGEKLAEGFKCLNGFGFFGLAQLIALPCYDCPCDGIDLEGEIRRLVLDSSFRCHQRILRHLGQTQTRLVVRDQAGMFESLFLLQTAESAPHIHRQPVD